MAKKEITYELVVEVKGADGKPVEKTITKTAKSMEEFGIAAEQAQNKLNKAPLGTKEFAKAAKGAKETEKAFEKAKNQAMGFGDRLAAIPGPIGGMVQSVKGLSKALIASPIGIITLALGALYKAFTSTKEGAETVQRAMAFLNAALDVLRDVLLPVTDLLVGLFTKPKETWDNFYNNTLIPVGNYFKDLGNIILGDLIKRFNNTLIGINKLRIGLNEFLGDEEEAAELRDKNNKLEEKNTEITNKQIEARERVAEANQKVANAVKNVVNEIVEEGKAAATLTGRLQDIEDRQRALNVERAEQNALISEAKRRATDETLSFEERQAALEEASIREQNLLNQELSLAEERLAAKLALAAQSDSSKEDLEEISQLEIQLANLKEQSTNKTKELQDQTKSLNDQRKAAAKEAADYERGLLDRLEEDERARQQRELENQKEADIQAIDNLKVTEEEKARLKLLAEEEYQQEKQKLKEQYEAEDRQKELETIDKRLELLDVKNAEDLAQLKSYLTQKMELELANEDLTYEDRELIKKRYDEAFMASESELTQFKLAQQQAQANIALQGLDVLKNVYGEESAAGKAAAVAQALINTYLGVSQTLADEKLPTIAKVVAVAAMLTSGLKNVQQIKGVKSPSFAEGGLVTGPGGPTDDNIQANVSSGESIINARSTSMFTPLLSALNEAGGGKRFDASGAMGRPQSMGESKTPIVKTYVVASDVTTEQQLGRVQKSRSII